MVSARHRTVPPDYVDRIKRLRARLGLTQMRLAELMGVSFASVNRWENGQTRPTQMAWRKIAMAEEVGVEALESDVLRGETAQDPEMGHTSGPDIEVTHNLLGEVAAERDLRIQFIIDTKTNLDNRECDQTIEGLNKILRGSSVKVGLLGKTWKYR
jgi:transcriptional regulator with XRE-family HTH domain